MKQDGIKIRKWPDDPAPDETAIRRRKGIALFEISFLT
jgi:hypothetical protein